MRYAFPPLRLDSLGLVFQAAILCAVATLVNLADARCAVAADWLTLPSTYTHDARGVRVHQFAQPGASYAPQVANFRSSGYTHTRSSIQFGPSSDNYHRVEQWGDPVRPYGEWRFPYRPYAQPYAAWGPPLAGLGPVLGGFPPGGYGSGYGNGHGHGHGHGNGNGNGGADPGNPYPPIPGGGYAVPPHYDGNYPSYPHRPRLNDQQFFSQPRP